MILSDTQIAEVRDLRYGDGLSCREVAARYGVSITTIQTVAPGRPGKVPVAPVRAIFEASGRTAASVAAEIGWVSPQAQRNGPKRLLGDSSRLRRRLGITPEAWGHGTERKTGYATLMDAEAASLIAEACGQPAWTVMPDEESEPIRAFDPTPWLR
jgi:hypothetical protein